MKQSIVWSLLSRRTEQRVLYLSEDGKINDTKELSERLALDTWEGLILLLRQSIANGDEVLLEEVGLFKKVNNQWIFEPAASLLEVDAMKLARTESHGYVAQKVLFHLEQATELLSNVPEDQELPSKTLIEPLKSVFGEATMADSMLSDRIHDIGDRLRRTAHRLQGERVPEPTQAAHDTAHQSDLIESRKVGKKAYKTQNRMATQHVYNPRDYTQDEINAGQRQINYALAQADLALIKVLTLLKEAIQAPPGKVQAHADEIHKAIAAAAKAIGEVELERELSNIVPPGTAAAESEGT